MRITLETLEKSVECESMGINSEDCWTIEPEDIDLYDVQTYRRTYINRKQYTRLLMYSGATIIVNMGFTEFNKLYYDNVVDSEESLGNKTDN
jgi:hypothetical protein